MLETSAIGHSNPVERGAAISGPFIFIARNRLKEGRFAAERERVAGLVELIEESETRLLAFNEYANEEGTHVGVVQVRRFRQRHAYTIWAGYVREHEGRCRPTRHQRRPFRQQRGAPRARRTGPRGRRSPRPANSRMQGSRTCP